MERPGYWLYKWTDETSSFDSHGRWNGGSECYERDYSMWIPDRIHPDDQVAVDDYIDKQFELSAEVADGLEVIKAADAQATIAALQARVKELEARQHFGACAKCLTNAWRICKEGTPDAVEMKCSNGSTWWLCDYCLSKEQLTQRTAELEAAKREVDVWKEKAELRGKEACAQRAELERVRDQFADLRKMVAALPKVEGAVVVSNGYVKDSTRCHALFGADEDAALYAALLQHRQGMEG